MTDALFRPEKDLGTAVGEPGIFGCPVEEQKARIAETTARLEADRRVIETAVQKGDALSLRTETRIRLREIQMQHLGLIEAHHRWAVTVIQADSRFECAKVYSVCTQTDKASAALAQDAARLAGTRPPPPPIDPDKGKGSGGGPLISVGSGLGPGLAIAGVAIIALLVLSRR